MKATIQYDEYPEPGGQVRRQLEREVDVGKLGRPAGTAWTCPRCGCMTFTVAERFGRIVLSCFRCPTHIGLIP